VALKVGVSDVDHLGSRHYTVAGKSLIKSKNTNKI